MRKWRRLGAYVYVPLIFMVLGYVSIYIVGKPVINFARSAISLLLLNDEPQFKQQALDLYATTDTSKRKIADGKLLASSITYPEKGARYGEVNIPQVKINIPLYYGDSNEILALGAGMYPNSKFPGEVGTTIIGGHNQPTFGKIYYLKTGEQFEIKTSYGEFTYEIISTQVIQANDPMVMAELGQSKAAHAFLYTCYPLDAIGLAAQRFVVIGKQVSGPIIDENK